MNHSFDIADLITRSFKNELTASEKELLEQWIAEEEANRLLYDRLADNQQLTDRVDIYQQFDSSKVLSNLHEQMGVGRGRTVTMSTYLRYAASIVLPLLASFALIYYFMFRTPVDSLVGIDTKIVPGVQKATLTLADGGQVILQAEQTPSTVQQGKTTVTNKGTTLVYQTETEESLEEQLIYNELTTPKGGKYTLNLSDGTRVTLNAGSSLRYPVSFGEDERKVFLTGEAYFDVQHTGAPFIVSSEQQQIRVLGTEFNVTAYTNELQIATTLVEGKVRVELDEETLLLAPGEQALLNKSTNALTREEVNTTLYTAWINGKFEFSNDDLDVVLRRLSRWYNFEYQFENKEVMDYHFTGRIESGQPFSSILQMLEATSDVRFELTEEETLIIK